MRYKPLVLYTTFLVFLTMAGLASGQTCQDVHGTTGHAPSPLEGSEVTLTGVVYVAPNTFAGTGMYFQCPGGAGGMKLDGASLVGLVNRGDEISVTGIVGASDRRNIQFEIGAVVTVLSNGNPEIVTPIASGDLAAGSNMIGGLLSVQGVLTNPWTDGFHHAFYLDDGSGEVTVFIYGQTGLTPEDFEPLMGNIVKVTGATYYFDTHGNISPRTIADLELIAVPAGDNDWGTLKASY